LAEPLGESVWQVVARACGHDRARRYASMAELAAALRRVRHALLGPALTPPPTPMLSQMTPLPMGVSGVQPAPRGVTLQQLVAMALVAALFGALVVVLSFGGDRDAETLEIIDVAAPSPTETSQGPAAPELSAPEPAAPEPPPAASTSASARAAASGAPSAAPRVPPPARRGPRQPCREIVCP
jgi:hypothetical protein